jgi:hypothetical protein
VSLLRQRTILVIKHMHYYMRRSESDQLLRGCVCVAKHISTDVTFIKLLAQDRTCSSSGIFLRKVYMCVFMCLCVGWLQP